MTAASNIQPVALSPEQLEKIKQRAEQATPGPWQVDSGDGETASKVFRLQEGGSWPEDFDEIADELLEYDAQFIARARADIPDLLQHIAYLEQKAMNEYPIRVKEKVLDGEQVEWTLEAHGNLTSEDLVDAAVMLTQMAEEWDGAKQAAEEDNAS